jgi:hypothetical protein
MWLIRYDHLKNALAAGPILVRAKIPSVTRNWPFLNHAQNCVSESLQAGSRSNTSPHGPEMHGGLETKSKSRPAIIPFAGRLIGGWRAFGGRAKTNNSYRLTDTGSGLVPVLKQLRRPKLLADAILS